MRRTVSKLIGGVAVAALLLTACGDESVDEPSGMDADGSAESEPADVTEDDGDDEVAADDADDTADEGDAEAATAGTATVTVGDEQYETGEVNCPESMSGVEFFGEADGPRDNARIHGRFGSSLPELIAVSFARGDEGEWAAIADNDVLDRGVLEDYAYDDAALTFSGTATFIWVENGGLMDPDSLTDGSFEVSCG